MWHSLELTEIDVLHLDRTSLITLQRMQRRASDCVFNYLLSSISITQRTQDSVQECDPHQEVHDSRKSMNGKHFLMSWSSSLMAKGHGGFDVVRQRRDSSRGLLSDEKFQSSSATIRLAQSLSSQRDLELGGESQADSDSNFGLLELKSNGFIVSLNRSGPVSGSRLCNRQVLPKR
jgi:hypothetical protein